jgi:hypothetical protein
MFFEMIRDVGIITSSQLEEHLLEFCKVQGIHKGQFWAMHWKAMKLYEEFCDLCN